MTPYAQKKWTLLDLAVLFVDWLQEIAGNHGLRINGIQRWCDGQDGESWCCYFVTWLLDILYQGKSPIPRMGSCQALLDLATQKGWIVNAPLDGDLIVFLNAAGHAHHIGILYWTGRCFISGNTNTNGSDDGYEVAWNPVPLDMTRVRLVRVPKP